MVIVNFNHLSNKSFSDFRVLYYNNIVILLDVAVGGIMEHHFKEFKYQPGIITNIIFKSDYLTIKTEFLKNLDERKIRVSEITEDCYNLIKANIFINDV